MAARKPAASSKNPAGKTKADSDEWIRVRKVARGKHTTADVDRMMEEALSKIDQEAAVKEIAAFRERYGIKPGSRARPRMHCRVPACGQFGLSADFADVADV